MTYTASPVLVTNQLHSGESTFWEKVFVVNGKNLVRIWLVLHKFSALSDWIKSRPQGVMVVCLVSHPSGGGSELAYAMGINPVIQIKVKK